MPDETFILTGDVVVTMDQARPTVDAVAVADGRVVDWGTVAELRSTVGATAPVREVAGTVVPGFIDSHVHMLWGGRAGERCGLAGSASVAEVCDRIRAFAAANPGSEWLEGTADIDAESLAEGRFPTRAELDDATGGRPLLLDRRSHDALANSAALAAAGIDASTPDPPGGVIERDEHGEATGFLTERPAADLVAKVVPPPSLDDRRRWLHAVQSDFHAAGLTGVVDPALEPDELAAYVSMADDGSLTIRTTAMPLGDGEVDPGELMGRFTAAGLDVHRDEGLLKVGPIKLFLDGGGSLGTALTREPWPGTGCYHGHQTTSSEGLRAYAEWCADNDRGLGVHCVGGTAIDLVLDTFAAVNDRRSIAELGFTLIHAYLWPSADNMARARDLGVFVTTQAPLQWSFGPGLVAKFGAEAIGRAHPFRSWLDAGVMVAGGSDGPGDVAVDPLFAFWQMQTRKIKGSDEPIGAHEAVTGEECLDLYTRRSAIVSHMPDAGRLCPGSVADITVLDVDPRTATADECLDGNAVLTLVAGRTVHEA